MIAYQVVDRRPAVASAATLPLLAGGGLEAGVGDHGRLSRSRTNRGFRVTLNRAGFAGGSNS